MPLSARQLEALRELSKRRASLTPAQRDAIDTLEARYGLAGPTGGNAERPSGHDTALAVASDAVTRVVGNVPSTLAAAGSIATYPFRRAAYMGRHITESPEQAATAEPPPNVIDTPATRRAVKMIQPVQQAGRELTGTTDVISPAGEFVANTVGDVVDPVDLIPGAATVGAIGSLRKGVRAALGYADAAKGAANVARRSRAVEDALALAGELDAAGDARSADYYRRLAADVEQRVASGTARPGRVQGGWTEPEELLFGQVDDVRKRMAEQRNRPVAASAEGEAVTPAPTPDRPAGASVASAARESALVGPEAPAGAGGGGSGTPPEPPAGRLRGEGGEPPQPPGGESATPVPEGRVPISRMDRAREYIEDDWIRVRRMQEDPRAVTTEGADPYTAETLFHGRVGSRVEEAKAVATAIDRDLVQTARAKGFDLDGMQRDVDRYLQAKHAPERNAVHGDGAAGISNDMAAQTLDELRRSPHGADVARIADQLQQLNQRTLDTLLEAQVITPDLYKQLRETYQYHVPLQRIMDDTEDVGMTLGSRPFDVKSTGVIAAKGSERQVADITTNILTNYEQAILRAEKNRVDLNTLAFARNNPDLGLFEEVSPKAIGRSFDGERILFEKVTDPQVLTLRENGTPVHLRIRDPHLAIALKGINRNHVDGLWRVSQTLTRGLASLATRYNPEFVVTNIVRDLQEASTYALSKQGLGFGGAAKTASGAPESMKAIIETMRGIDTPGSRLYRQMKMDGGTTGGLGLSTRADVELNVEALRAANRSAPRAALKKSLEVIDHWNTIFEDSTRLSVYRAALESGASREQAARMAKEASVNFNKFGRGGPQINALYMFANASIQGSMKMARAMKNPKVAGAVVTTVAASVAAINSWNDEIDPGWREKVTKWDRLNSLPVMIPTTEGSTYLAIPVSWGIKPIKVAMDYAMDAASGHAASPAAIGKDVLVAALESYNPVGGTDLASAIMPTVGDIPQELARNRAWHGGMIKPDWDPHAPASEEYFDSLSESPAGRMAIAGTQRLSGAGIEVSPADVVYAYESITGGAGRFVKKVADTGVAAAKGEAPPVREMPFVSRVVRDREEDVIRTAPNTAPAEEALTEQSRQRWKQRHQAKAFEREIDDLPREARMDRVRTLARENPDVLKRVLDERKRDALGRSRGDDMVAQLGVENGRRAAYIREQMASMSAEEKRAYLSDLFEKKLVTRRVLEQLVGQQ